MVSFVFLCLLRLGVHAAPDIGLKVDQDSTVIVGGASVSMRDVAKRFVADGFVKLDGILPLRTIDLLAQARPRHAFSWCVDMQYTTRLYDIFPTVAL